MQAPKCSSDLQNKHTLLLIARASGGRGHLQENNQLQNQSNANTWKEQSGCRLHQLVLTAQSAQRDHTHDTCGLGFTQKDRHTCSCRLTAEQLLRISFVPANQTYQHKRYAQNATNNHQQHLISVLFRSKVQTRACKHQVQCQTTTTRIIAARLIGR